MNKKRGTRDADAVRKKLAFQRGVLTLVTMVKETELFRPMIDQAMEDIEELLEQVD